MLPIQVIWDLEDDPDGNVTHISEHGIAREEVEDVLFDPNSEIAINRNPSGHKITFGFTSSGRYLAVVWEHIDDDPLTIYSVTSYDVLAPRDRGH